MQPASEFPTENDNTCDIVLIDETPISPKPPGVLLFQYSAYCRVVSTTFLDFSIRNSVPAMSAAKKHVVFDVVGTCVSYDNFFQAIDDRLGEKLKAEGIKPKLLGFAWMEASERECKFVK